MSSIAPLIIDEADTDIDAFRRAIDLGYAGVSIKACKGVFRALANRALLDAMDQKHLFQSGEDLTNLASIPLQQDLALQVTLGISTLLTHVAIPVAAAHQGGSVLLLTTVLFFAHARLTERSRF